MKSDPRPQTHLHNDYLSFYNVLARFSPREYSKSLLVEGGAHSDCTTCDEVTGECMCNSGYSGQTCENKKPDPKCMGGGCGTGTCASDSTCICPINTSGSKCQTLLITKATHTSVHTIVQRIILVVLIIALAVMLILLFTGKLDKYSKRS